MTLRQLVDAVRRSVLLIVACVLVGAAAAGLYSALRADRYVSESELFLSVTQTAEGASRQDTLYLQQRMQSYAAVLASPALGQRVAGSLDLDLTGEQVASRISVSVPAETVLLVVQVQDSSAQRAQQIAESVGEEFSELLVSLEGTGTGPVQAVDVTTIQPPSVPTSPAGPGTALLVLAGALAGLVLGAGLAFLRAGLDDTVRDGDEVAALGLLHLGTVPAQRRRRGGELRAGRDLDRADALRSVRLRLLAAAGAEPRTGMAVTIAALRETADVAGLCRDLASVLAEGGARVVVVDVGAGELGPVSPGAVHRPDLVEILEGRADAGARLEREPQRVQVLQGADGPPDSSLLHGPGMAALLTDLTGGADFVLLAVPPFGRRPDAEAVAAASDGVVLVVEAGRTRRRLLLRAVRTLETLQIRLLGVLIDGRTRG